VQSVQQSLRPPFSSFIFNDEYRSALIVIRYECSTQKSQFSARKEELRRTVAHSSIGHTSYLFLASKKSVVCSKNEQKQSCVRRGGGVSSQQQQPSSSEGDRVEDTCLVLAVQCSLTRAIANKRKCCFSFLVLIIVEREEKEYFL
jgi:hypothetical protein